MHSDAIYMYIYVMYIRGAYARRKAHRLYRLYIYISHTCIIHMMHMGFQRGELHLSIPFHTCILKFEQRRGRLVWSPRWR